MDAKDSCIFRRNWLDAAHTIADPKMRCYFFEAVIQYALTGMKMDVPPELNLALGIIYSLIDIDRDKYEKKIEKRREAGRKHSGNQYTRAAEQNGTNGTSVPNVEQNGTNGTYTVTDTDTDTVTDTDDNNVIKDNTPKSPKGTLGGEESFRELVIRFMVMAVPKKVMDLHFEMQYAWRAKNPGFVMDVSKACQTIGDTSALESEISRICKVYPGDGEFGRIKLAMKTARLKTEAQRRAVVDELKRSQYEPRIYETLSDKADYILQGNKVTSLAGFMRSRPT